ncbi:hypothetical protein [Streptomyces flavofungini]|uniref:hypothetical protein n=1 Tax=Streptomyces flavofungini TaxID=68200 RepID=UPI0034DFE12A
MAALAAVLAVAGCGSDGDGGGVGGGGKKDRGSSSSGGSGDSGSSGSGSGAKGAGLEGSWVATADGKPLALVIHEKTATLVGEDVLCNGTTGDKAGSRTIDLTCPKGDSARTAGRVESVDAKTLKVVWEGAGRDEFLRTDGGELPDGLPTGVPSEAP